MFFCSSLYVEPAISQAVLLALVLFMLVPFMALMIIMSVNEAINDYIYPSLVFTMYFDCSADELTI